MTEVEELELEKLEIRDSKNTEEEEEEEEEILELRKKTLKDLPFEVLEIILMTLPPASLQLLALGNIHPFAFLLTGRFYMRRIAFLLDTCLSPTIQSMIKPSLDLLCPKPRPLFSSDNRTGTSWYLVFEKLYKQLVTDNKLANLAVCSVCKMDFKKKLGEHVNSRDQSFTQFSWSPHCNNQKCAMFKETGSFGSKKGNAYEYGWF